jgi:predicted DNA-binding transcriptional regulator AlpA
MYQNNLSHTALSGLQSGDPVASRPLPTHLTRARRDNSCEERYVSRRELRRLFPVSDMTIWRWQQDPQIAFPAPVKLAVNGRNFWWLPAIRDWEQRRRNPVKASGNAP